jgi:hypothetical protein
MGLWGRTAWNSRGGSLVVFVCDQERVARSSFHQHRQHTANPFAEHRLPLTRQCSDASGDRSSHPRPPRQILRGRLSIKFVRRLNGPADQGWPREIEFIWHQFRPDHKPNAHRARAADDDHRAGAQLYEANRGRREACFKILPSFPHRLEGSRKTLGVQLQGFLGMVSAPVPVPCFYRLSPGPSR